MSFQWRTQQLALSGQQSAVSNQHSAVSNQQSALSNQPNRLLLIIRGYPRKSAVKKVLLNADC
jgi:hypothetical protein